MRVWCKPCTRVVWCRWTSASICCELRGSARIWGREEGDSLLLPQDIWLSPHLWFPCFPVTAAVPQPLGSPATRDASHPVGQHTVRGTCFARKISKCQLDGNVPPARSWVSPPISPDSMQIAAPPVAVLLYPQHQREFVPDRFLKVSQISAQAAQM